MGESIMTCGESDNGVRDWGSCGTVALRSEWRRRQDRHLISYDFPRGWAYLLHLSPTVTQRTELGSFPCLPLLTATKAVVISVLVPAASAGHAKLPGQSLTHGL